MAQRKVYYIPDNFVDDEKIFGGKFRKRNFIEAVVFTLPVLGLFWLINWATGIGWGTLLSYISFWNRHILSFHYRI